MKHAFNLLSVISFGLALADKPQSTERATPPAPVAPAVEHEAPAGVTSQSRSADGRPIGIERASDTGPAYALVDPLIVEIDTDLAAGLHRYTILFFTDESVESYEAFARAMALVKSHWHLVSVPITHPLAAKYGYTTAPQFVALLDGVEVGCSDGATYADLYAMLTLAYAPQYAAAFESSTAAKETWSLASLKAWLAKYETNPARTTTGVAGRTVYQHLTDATHGYPPALVASLTQREQQLLHDADHDGLCAPDGPLADPLTRPAKRKAAVARLPPVTNCPNCQRRYW